MQLDATLPEACATLAYIRFWFDWKWTDAEQLLERAIELGPNSALAHNYRAVFLGNLGAPHDGVAAARRSIELDPFWPTAHHDLGFTSFQAGDYAGAVAAFNRALELSPDYSLTLLVKGMALMELGDVDGALDTFRHCEKLLGGVSHATGCIVRALAEGGRTAEARRALEELRERSASTHSLPSVLAQAHAALGDVDAAIGFVERMIVERDAMSVCLATYYWWDPLRSDPRFTSILVRLNFSSELRAISEARRLAFAERVSGRGELPKLARQKR